MERSRQELIGALADILQDDPSVHAMWLEGSDACGTSDQYSDIDIWLDVEDGKADAVLVSMKAVLAGIGPLDYEYRPEHPHPQIRQAFFHVQGTSEFMVVDVCIQDHSRPSAFRKDFADHQVKVVFDKCGVIAFEEVDRADFERQLSRRVEELEKSFPLSRVGVRKGIMRGDYLEALDYYQGQMLKSLVEILRIKHQPRKHEYDLKHIRRDLPKQIVASLEDLFVVSSVADIESKSSQAEELFHETLRSLQTEDRLGC
jgi:predicted nucleotidyltransferase